MYALNYLMGALLHTKCLICIEKYVALFYYCACFYSKVVYGSMVFLKGVIDSSIQFVYCAENFYTLWDPYIECRDIYVLCPIEREEIISKTNNFNQNHFTKHGTDLK